MLDQETVNRNGNEQKPAAGVQRNLAGLAHDFAELTELQAKLLVADTSEAWSGSKRSIAILIGGIILAVSSVPIFLIGVAWGIAESTDVSRSIAFLCTGLFLGVLPAAGLIWLAMRALQADVKILGRSMEEFNRNLRWLKRALKRQTGTSPGR